MSCSNRRAATHKSNTCILWRQVLAQFLYTSIFGWYAAWLFVRSGHLAAPVAVHAACNALGFPDFERMSR